MREEIAVSVLCTAYNHQSYIAKALESFLMQKTDFLFEVLVNDDASTDATADIIRQYEEKYPEIIKPIYQKENQHQKGVDSLKQILFPAAKGKYIAICEGDDYWTDPTKLQQQFDYMQEHPDCPLVAHESIKIFENGDLMGKFSHYDFSAPGACCLRADMVITHVNDFHTSSLFLRKESYVRNRAFFESISGYDFAIKTLFATDLAGYAYIIPQKMSAYRVSAVGSWSQRIRDDKKKYETHIKESIQTLEKIDQYRGYKYTQAFEKEILNRRFKIEVLNGNKAAWKQSQYRSLIEEMTKRQRIVNYLNLCMPKLFQTVYGVYQRCRKFIGG